MNTDAKYTSYQNMVTQVNTGLVQMQTAALDMNLEETGKSLEDSRQKLEKRKFAVGILGEFKRGKSTVINSLLGKEIMPADILPTSATMNRVTYDMQPHVELWMRDHTVKEIGIDELPRYVTKLSEEDEARAALVDEAVVYYPCKFCQNGVDIVDTPGLNDDARMSKITEEIIPKLDVVIMVLVPDNPLSISEADFVLNKLMTSDLGRLIFVVNKIDTIRRKEDRERAVANIKNRIQEKVLEKIAQNYGETSQEYADAKLKIGKIRIFSFSALDALEGKMDGDDRMIERSGTIPLEEELTRILTEERGAIELQIPLSSLQRAAKEIAGAVEVRKNALQMSSQEFEEQQNEMLEQISQIRTKKTEEKRRLREKATSVRTSMEMQVAEYYPQLNAELKQTLEETYIAPESLETQAGQDAAVAQLQKAVTDKMQSSMSSFSEKMEMQLRDIAGQEAARLGDFTQSVSDQLDQLRNGIGKTKSTQATSVAAGMAADLLFANIAGGIGLGGVIAGYREAGFKGAAIGGAAGFAAQLVVANVLIGMALPALPLALITLAAGPAAGRFIVKKVFRKDAGAKKLSEIRSIMSRNLDDMIADMQAKAELEKWIRQRISDVFDNLQEALEKECETLLKDTQNTMDSIKKDILENEMQKEKLLEKFDKNLETTVQIIKDLEPVSRRVNLVLNPTEE